MGNVSANADFDALAQLDKQIKSFNVGPNPYTWFTMEALSDTWKNLQLIIKQRDMELAQEEVRQEENDKLRKEFARLANSFYSWLTETRALMMEGSGTLEEQLAAVGIKAHEVAGRATDLRKIEDLGAILEEQLILARNQCGVAEDALKEFSMMFRHFDKDKTGKLDHNAFKSCLRALGYDLPMVEDGEPEPEFEAILDSVDLNRDGVVSLQDYMAFMISKETENVQSSEEIENAFRAITQEREHVTRSELYDHLSKDMADYCIGKMQTYKDPRTDEGIPDAYDFMEFTRTLFQNS